MYLVLSEQSLVVPSRDVQVVQEPEHLNLLRQGVNAPLDRVQDKTPQSFGRDFLQKKKNRIVFNNTYQTVSIRRVILSSNSQVI